MLFDHTIVQLLDCYCVNYNSWVFTYCPLHVPCLFMLFCVDFEALGAVRVLIGETILKSLTFQVGDM